MTLDPRLDTYDWEHIFAAYASDPASVRSRRVLTMKYTREDVVDVVALEDGENDGAEWVGLFLLVDGLFLVLRAGCDYTGWGCQESGSAEIADCLEDAIFLGLTQEERGRLRSQLHARGAVEA